MSFLETHKLIPTEERRGGRVALTLMELRDGTTRPAYKQPRFVRKPGVKMNIGVGSSIQLSATLSAIICNTVRTHGTRQQAQCLLSGLPNMIAHVFRQTFTTTCDTQARKVGFGSSGAQDTTAPMMRVYDTRCQYHRFGKRADYSGDKPKGV